MRTLAIAFSLALLLLPPGSWHFYPPYGSENERFGVGLAGTAPEILRYDVEQLDAGWYTNWGTARYPPHPNGVEYIQTVRLSGSSYWPDQSTIAQIASANPGSLWVIGNEPDCIYQDSSTPSQYAVVYHDLYGFIKGQDPSARVAIGGVVQATPLRLQYLDLVLAAYAARYGGMIPVDVWNVHGFILRERAADWGCEIPPGLGAYAAMGRAYDVRDQDSMVLFKEHITNFRQWMKDKGEQNKPLIVSEYGILWPPDYQDEDHRTFDHARVRDFMLATFDFFLGIDPEGIDADLGYPDDGHRLAQAWAWYSLEDRVYGYNGDLYEGSIIKQLTPLGQDYADYIQQNGLINEYVDLYPKQLSLQCQDPVYGQPITLSITAEVANDGNVTTTAPVEVQLWEGDPEAGGISLGVISTTSTVPPRYQGHATASMTWQTVATGTCTIYARVDPAQAIAEPREDNNMGTRGLSFYTDWAVSDVGVAMPVPVFSGGVVTLTLMAEIDNGGNTAGQGLQVEFSEVGGPLIGEATLGPAQAPGSSSRVEISWPVDRAGLHHIRVLADPADAFLEPNESDNELLVTVLVPSSRAFLPLLPQTSSPGG